MARRDFRQFGLADGIVQRRGKKTAWLERLDAALDWAAVETIVEGIYASREGGPAYPLLTYVKLLLLQQWYGLSDEGLEAAVDDRLSFRRFAGVPLAESVPDHSSVWRCREELARRDLAARLLAEVNRQLDAKGLILRRGTLIDATIREAAVRPPTGDAGEVSERDPQAGWTKKNGKSRFGYKAHAAVDEGSGIVREAVMPPADVHDSVPADDLVQGDERAVYADKAGACPPAGAAGPGGQRGATGRATRARDRAADHAQGPPRPAAQALAGGVQQGRRADPGRGRAAVRDHEAGLRPSAGALPRAGAQRRPAAGDVRRHQPAPGARPRAGLRGGVRPVRPGTARRRSG
jgi:IS5 family transposase